LNQPATELQVGGLTRLSTCDWPGQLAATIFCQGCAWDCPYCHNPALRPTRAERPLAWSAILDFLERRRGLLDAVVFSGGEPTLQSALPAAVAAVRALGFRVGLHTAGMAPARFATLLPSLDWVGFDVKAPFEAYARITGVEHSGVQAQASLHALLASGIAYEVRTTVHPDLLSEDDLSRLKVQLLAHGVTRFVLQRFRPHGALSGRLCTPHAAPALAADFGSGFADFSVR
jgi:pyruvate formate lyase activating enzyme